MLNFLKITDEFTHTCGLRIRNKVIVCFFAIVQIVVASVSLAQHVFSVIYFQKIFNCSFNGSISISNSTSIHPSFLSYDVIIFDFGLFHELVQVQECIANYLDGGYMRCLWCVMQIIALLIALTCINLIPKAHPLLLWPLLTVQNAYCFGLMILTIATADKLLLCLLHPLNGHLNFLIVIFFSGTISNHFFNYILWHYYWYEEAEYTKRTASQVLPFWI